VAIPSPGIHPQIQTPAAGDAGDAAPELLIDRLIQPLTLS
jgi:hypothetical protein